MKPIPFLALAVIACSEPATIPAPRFANAPPVREVGDRRGIPEPQAHRTLVALYMFDGSVTRPLTHPFTLEKHQRAAGVNSLDEVPDSSWFTNRIGVREMSLDEIRRGPNVVGNPELHVPWTIIRKKSNGDAPGIFIRDARGAEFLVKVDRAGDPESESSTQVIVGHLLWACGYNVTDDYIARIELTDLVFDPDAYIPDELGDKKPFHPTDLAKMLEGVEREPDGRLRVLASYLIPGKAIGGHANEGRRADDPNDVIPHELRRDLRGTRAIFAWLDHADVKENNSLDVWAADPAAPGQRFVKHYFLDYGKALGVMALANHDRRRGVHYEVDFADSWGSLVTFGLRPRTYEQRTKPPYRGVGLYDLANYDPAKWRADTQAYVPLLEADRVDWFWGAKILMRFSRAQLRAAVETGQLSDPRAVTYLTDMLVARQRTTAAHAFARVSPLDHFDILPSGSVCFDDLVTSYGLSTHEPRYWVHTYARDARSLSGNRAVTASGPRSCTGPLPLSRNADGYTIVRIDTRREKTSHAVYVHVAREPLEHRWTVIGIWRE